MIQRFPHDRRAAFTLIELSIVLIIISLIASALLTVGINKTVSDKVEVTRERMQTVEQAIGYYVLRNGALPCPADGAGIIKSLTFGDADCGANVISVTTPAPSTFNIVAGAVPTSTLLISDEYMFDGWGRRFTYVVDARFTGVSGFKRHQPDATGNKTGGVYVYAREDGAAAPPTRSTQAVYVLLSHGANGHGAWLKNGGANTRVDSGSADVAELENAHDPADDTSFDGEFTQMPMNATFDDMVDYKEYWQVIADAGGIVDDTLCELAQRTLKRVDLTASPVEGPVNCGGAQQTVCQERQLALAQAVLDLCLVAAPAVK